MKFVLLLSLFVLSAWGALQYNEKEYGEIILQVVPIMTRSENNPQVLVYDDRSTGSNRDGSFYRPQCTNGARPLGHYAQGNYGTPQTVVLCVRPSSTANPSSPPLVSPTGYGQTWNDRGSGGSFDGSFWAPNAPSGYRCLGHVSVRGYGAPGTGEVYCVRNDLTKEGVIGGLIWNDQGSGANWDGAFWAINVPSSISTVASDRALFAPNTYFGVGNYGVPNQQVYVLNLVLPTYQESLPPVTPLLTSCAQPAAETSNLLDNSVWVPMTAISDPSTSFLWKIQNSPFYRVQRVSNYNLQLFQTNIGTVTQSLSKAITFGTSTEQSRTVSTETTLTIGFETGASFLGVGGKVTGSIAIALGYSSTTSISNFQQTTTTLTLNTPPNACGALWTQKDTLRFIRGDGSVMNNAVISFASGVTNVVYGQYAF